MNTQKDPTAKARTDAILVQTRSFTLRSPAHPHVPACDGGHLFLEVNDPAIEDRTQLSAEAAIECMWFTMVAGQAFAEIMSESGQELYRINYQDNGNWSFLRGERPRMHIHLYGRIESERSQTYGQALFFPAPEDERYRTFEPLGEDMLKRISARVMELAASPKYQWHQPVVLERAL